MTTKKYETKLARKNIYMSHEIAEWYEDQAEKMGVSQSALMTMALNQYITQVKSVSMGDSLEKLAKFLEDQSPKE